MLMVGSSVLAAAWTARTIARFGRFSGSGQGSDAFRPRERIEQQLGTLKPFFPQAGPRPEALQSGRYAEGGRI